MNLSINFKQLYKIFREMTTVVHSSTRVDEVLELVTWRTTTLFDAKGAVLRILNLNNEQIEMFSSYGLSEKYISRKPALRRETILDLCRLNKVIIIDDVLSDPRIQNKKEVWEEGIRMILDIPLVIREHILGIMRIYFSEQREFSSDELDLFIAIAEVSGCAIDKARLIEEQQSQYDHLALQAEKLSALGRMAAGIAHEINNPLAGILLFSTNMRKKVPEEGSLREGLDVIIQETQRCKGIIQDLLEFSRDKEPEKKRASINEIVEKALHILENEFHLHHISVEKNLSSTMPDILLDENLMQQVFVNLFINAVEAIKEKGTITITTHMSPDQKSEQIEINDTGSGIPPENMARLFEPFFSTKTNGTGLGLAVSYGIVHKHQGHIRVSSQPGEGTHFTIEIPLVQ